MRSIRKGHGGGVVFTNKDKEVEDKKIDEEMKEIDEHAQEVTDEDMTRVDPFKIGKMILEDDLRKYLEECFRDGEDNTILASVEDGSSYVISKKEFWGSPDLNRRHALLDPEQVVFLNGSRRYMVVRRRMQ
ncbi:hypothetical protein Tco_1075893 [Tanacetum coccineum]